MKGKIEEQKDIMQKITKKYQEDWLFIGQNLLDSLSFLTNNPPTYTIINTGTLSNDVISLTEKDFDRAYPTHEKFQQYIEHKVVHGNVWDFLNNQKNAKKDITWTTERNKDYKWEAYIKYDYTPELQSKILSILKEIQSDMITYQDVDEKLRAAEKAERDQAQKEFEVEILKKSTRAGGEGGSDPCAKVRIIDPKTKELAIFNCRNLFDFGYVVNPEGGGLASNVENCISENPHAFDTEEKRQQYRDEHPTKTGWGWNRNFLDGENWIEMTNFEIRAIKYLDRFSPINTEIRM